MSIVGNRVGFASLRLDADLGMQIASKLSGIGPILTDHYEYFETIRRQNLSTQ
jgi:hypothetical protein